MNDLNLQDLIDSGTAWVLEGSIGRAAMSAIETGLCVLGTEAHWDYWGNRVPARTELAPGSLGTIEYANAQREERGELPIYVKPITKKADRSRDLSAERSLRSACNRPAGHDGDHGAFIKSDHDLQVSGWTWCQR